MMNKYRVLKSLPKYFMNAGRMVTLTKGAQVYLKDEPQVIRLVLLGFLQQIVEVNTRQPVVKEAKADKKYKVKKLEQEQ